MSDTTVQNAAATISAQVQSPAAKFQAPVSKTAPAADDNKQAVGSGVDSSPAAKAENQSTPVPGKQEAAQDVYDYVVNGKQGKVSKATIDAAAKELGMDPTELLKGGQITKSGFDRLRQANELNKQLSSFVETWRKDPGEALERLTEGKMSPQHREAIGKWVLKQYEAEMLPPEQKRALELEQREAALRAREEAEKAARAEKERAEKEAAEDAIEAPKLDAEYEAAFASVSIPKTPSFVRRVAEQQLEYLDAGVQITAVDAAKLVKREMSTYVSTIKNELGSIDDVRRVFGDDLIDQIRKLDVEKYNTQAPRQSRGTNEQPAQQQAQKSKSRGPISQDEAEAKEKELLAQFFGRR